MDDIWSVVAKHILKGNWISFTSTCKLFYKFNTPEERQKREHKLSTEVLHNDKEWDWLQLSKNKDLSIEVLNKYINKPWALRFLSKNKNLTLDFILSKVSKPWNCWIYEDIKHTGFTLEHLVNNRHIHLDWSQVCESPDINFEIIKKTPHAKWNWSLLSCHPNIPIKTILEHSDMFKLNLYSKISEHPELTRDIIKKHKHIIWDTLTLYERQLY